MNTRTFTTSYRSYRSYRRTLFGLLIAATLVLTTIFGQAAVSSLTGLALTSTAHACQGSGGTGSC